MDQLPPPKDNFFFSLLKEAARWFSRGIGSCASLVLGYFFVTAAILSVILALSGGSKDASEYSQDTQQVFRDYGGNEKIALVELSGIILERVEASSPLYASYQAITPDGVENLLDKVRNDNSIKGVILNISSPGGSPVASDLIYEVISDFKRDTSLPVVVLMGDVAASGGYYISAPADYIYANPSTITGSIGVILETFNLSGLYEKIGVQKQTFKSGEFKDILSESRDITPQEAEMIQALMNDAYNTFLTRVSAGRSIPIERLTTLADGRIYSGIGAKEAGLIDSVGTMNDAIAYTANKAGLTKYKVVKISSSSLFDELFGGVSYALKNTGIKISLEEVSQPKFRILYKLP